MPNEGGRQGVKDKEKMGGIHKLKEWDMSIEA